jgi:hypothetical protein
MVDSGSLVSAPGSIGSAEGLSAIRCVNSTRGRIRASNVVERSVSDRVNADRYILCQGSCAKEKKSGE